MQKVRWGVLGVSKIATVKVIPAMQRGQWCEIAAIASRDGAKAEEAAGRLGIPKAYGSYQEMLDDPGIEAIYNPLPNHLHVPWSIRAAEAGKHVLCEKPGSMTVAECRSLMGARGPAGGEFGGAGAVALRRNWRSSRRDDCFQLQQSRPEEHSQRGGMGRWRADGYRLLSD